MYPTVDDYLDYLVAANILKSRPEDTALFARYLNSAIQRFEFDTKWSPFYSDGLVHTYQYDVKRDSFILWLRTGIIRLDSVYVGGSPFTIDSNIWARGGWNNRPNDRLEFLGRPDILHNIVSVTGIWGYTQTIDDTVNNAILKRATSQIITFLQGPNGRVYREEQGPLKLFYGAQTALSKVPIQPRDQFIAEYKSDIVPYIRKRI